MSLNIGILAFLLLHARVAVTATPTPTIVLDNGTFTGVATTVGDLRFRLPTKVVPYTGVYNATAMSPACPQQTAVVPILSGVVQKIVGELFEDFYSNEYPSAEDCLNLNIIKPANATADSKLPVVLKPRYDGVPIVQRSIAMGQPIIYISINYRVPVTFGFLGGKEVREAGVGNLGLQDQREALRWVQKYIAAFAVIPRSWGESAGAISVSLQMLANGGDTEGLFRAGYMQSGSPVPVGPIENGQKYYDDLVAQTGCSGSADTLACLRTVPYAKLKAAQDASPFSCRISHWFSPGCPEKMAFSLTDNPQRLVQQGKVANVPFITGDCDDEGTIFSLSTLNITTDAEFKDYIAGVWAPTAGADTVDALTSAYPDDITQGSPFGTGILQALTPQFKRLASFQGDAVFSCAAAVLQAARSGKQPQWAYLNKRYKAVPFLGAFHTTDVFNVYKDGELTDYLINFPKTQVTQDTFREEAMKVLTDVSLQFPI
ncbi:Alpha/Beta hydrolase protein [Mycena leptocephala]|nr:Alpha/Beta hydrolase protein [Mycena leptocephala]